MDRVASLDLATIAMFSEKGKFDDGLNTVLESSIA